MSSNFPKPTEPNVALPDSRVGGEIFYNIRIIDKSTFLKDRNDLLINYFVEKWFFIQSRNSRDVLFLFFHFLKYPICYNFHKSKNIYKQDVAKYLVFT